MVVVMMMMMMMMMAVLFLPFFHELLHYTPPLPRRNRHLKKRRPQVLDAEVAVCIGSDTSSNAQKMRVVLLVQVPPPPPLISPFLELSNSVAAGP